ncbi:unnamed protein product, partial [Rotaria sp. Silwood1]
TQQQVIRALSHIERITKEKSYLFLQETPKRHRPPFEETLSQEKKTKFKANLVNQTCLTDMNEQFSISIIYQWLDTIIASLHSLWSKYPQDTIRAIGSLFYNNDLTKLILTCVFNRTQLGFDINNEEINKKLLERILNSLKSMTTHLADQL